MSIGLGMGIDVRNASARRKGVRGFRSAFLRRELAWDGARGFRSVLLRHELAWDGARGFGSALLRHELTQDGVSRFRIGKGCLGMVLKTQE